MVKVRTRKTPLKCTDSFPSVFTIHTYEFALDEFQQAQKNPSNAETARDESWLWIIFWVGRNSQLYQRQDESRPDREKER
jgi:hypothetical protein